MCWHRFSRLVPISIKMRFLRKFNLWSLRLFPGGLSYLAITLSNMVDFSIICPIFMSFLFNVGIKNLCGYIKEPFVICKKLIWYDCNSIPHETFFTKALLLVLLKNGKITDFYSLFSLFYNVLMFFKAHSPCSTMC